MKKIFLLIPIGFLTFHMFAQGTWVQKANMPDTAKLTAVAFTIGNKGYLGTGHEKWIIPTVGFWEYDPATDSWTQKSNFAGGIRRMACGFSIGTKGYIGTGWDSDINFSGIFCFG